MEFAIISDSKTISPLFLILYLVWGPYSTILFHQILFSEVFFLDRGLLMGGSISCAPTLWIQFVHHMVWSNVKS
jgi:hypothetical protein